MTLPTSPVVLIGALAVIILTCSTSGVQSSQAECNGKQNAFKPNAAERVRASFKETLRRGKSRVEFDKIVITWEPFMMVENPACVDRAQLNLEIKVGDAGSWVAIEESPVELGGGRYQWTVDSVPCMDHYIKLWVSGEGGQAALEYPEPILAASQEELEASGYTPSAPADLTVTVLDEMSVKVSWTPSTCASTYEIYYSKVLDTSDMKSRIVKASEGNEVVLSNGLEPCGEYRLLMSAVTGEEGYSDEVETKFSTPPDSAAADKLTPLVVPGIDQVQVEWKAFEQLSCVTAYTVSVCKNGDGQCDHVEEVSRDDALSYARYSAGGLDECTRYSVSVRPLFDNLNLAPKLVDFRTLSPPVGDVLSQLGPVTATKGEAQAIYVQWNEVRCAERYEVFQKVSQGHGDWESIANVIGDTGETSISINGVPCTGYRYGVRVTVNGQESDIIETETAIVTKLEATAAFVVPNLEVEPLADGARLTWDHGACIKSYDVSTCHMVGGDRVCEESVLESMEPSSHNITHELHGLNACTDYTLKIVPTVETGEEFDAESVDFRTGHEPASPPPDFTAQLNPSGTKLDLAWGEVACATGYQVLQLLPSSDTEVTWQTEDPQQLSNRFQNPEPCVTYRYSVATVIGEEVSEPSEWAQIYVPPRKGTRNQPRFEVKESENGTVSFSILPSNINTKCQVEKYHVKFASPTNKGEVEEQIFEGPMEGGDSLVLKMLPGTEFSLEGRIKYAAGGDQEVWSSWIKPRGPMAEAAERVTDNSMLVPIIIGILVGVVVVVVLVFFVVRRNKSRNKFDAEADKDGKDETQKLNEHNEV